MQVFSTLPHLNRFDGLGRDIVDPLNQERDFLGVPLPHVLLGDIPLHCLFPLHPGTLLLYGHCSAYSLFLDGSVHLVLHHLMPLPPAGSVISG